MTITGEFIPGEYDQQDAAPAYPSAFGLQMTPQVIGALVAVAGLAGAAYLFMQLVQPVMQSNAELKSQIEAEEAKKTSPQERELARQKAEADLAQAKQRQASVLGLFSDTKNLDTLLLDINKRIENRNTALKPEDAKAKLVKFQPDPQASGVVTDGSLGPSVNGKLYREVYRVELEGTFDQTRLVMLELERLKPLLVVKNLKSQLDSTERVRVDLQGAKLVPVQPVRTIKTAFQLQALRPLTAEEKAKLQPPAQAGQQPNQ